MQPCRTRRAPRCALVLIVAIVLGVVALPTAAGAKDDPAPLPFGLAAASAEGPVAAAYGDGPVCVGMTGPLSGEICRYYRAFFQRDPDYEGLLNWMWWGANGVSSSVIAQHFAVSAEFKATYGELTDREFIEVAYRNIFDRAPDDYGAAYWMRELSWDQPRGAVVASMANSHEFVVRTNTHFEIRYHTAQTYRLYLAYFSRLPDWDGWSYWQSRISFGASLDEVSEAFAASAEFEATYGNLDNRRFVQLVYENVMLREADLIGLRYWTILLDRGELTRGEMMARFSESPEFCMLTDTRPW